jgi:hypothetical protein
VGGEAKLDLAVVGREDDIAGLGDEGVADAAADLGSDRDVLEVGVGRGEAAGLGARQRVAGVDPAGFLVDLLLQRVGVGRFELGELAPFEHQLAIGTPSRDSRSSSLTSVDQVPDLPLRPPFRPILPNSMSPSCCGLPMVKVQPASPQIRSSSAAIWVWNNG